MKDNFSGGMEFLKSLAKIIERQNHLMQPFQAAVKQLQMSGIAQYENLVNAPSFAQVGAVGSALMNGTVRFDNTLAQQLARLYAPYESIASIETLMKTRFQDLVHPILYTPGLCGMETALSSFSAKTLDIVPKNNISWMHTAGLWQTELEQIASLDTTPIQEMMGSFAKLVQLEKETSRIAIISERFAEITSVSAQLASIQASVSGISEQWQNLILPTGLLEDYGELAIRQHLGIQKAAANGDAGTVAWRLDLLESTSKVIDRQVKWANEFLTDIQDDIRIEDTLPSSGALNITLIPKYIGYSKRTETDVDHALAESKLTVIPEKGKLIVQQARLIKRCSIAAQHAVLFSDTDSLLDSYLILSSTFCKTSAELETVVNALYEIFINQLDAISLYVDISKHHCLQKIEYLRNSGAYPEREKDVSFLQNTLYDGLIELGHALITEISQLLPGKKRIEDTLEEYLWSEAIISQNIYRALQNLQGNRLFWGKTENEMNDAVRDFLKMVYNGGVLDQSRQGISENGNDAGEVDLQICKDGIPVTLIEGLKLDSVNHGYIKKHIDKVLTNYDPYGCPLAYVVMYVNVENFASFWNRFLEFMKTDYTFPFDVKADMQDLNCMYANSRHGKAVLLRNSIEVTVHFYAIFIR